MFWGANWKSALAPKGEGGSQLAIVLEYKNGRMRTEQSSAAHHMQVQGHASVHKYKDRAAYGWPPYEKSRTGCHAKYKHGAVVGLHIQKHASTLELEGQDAILPTGL